MGVGTRSAIVSGRAVAGDRLFVGQLVHEVQQACSEATVRAVQQLSEEQLTSVSVEELTGDILADKVPPLIQLHVANHGFTTNVVQLPARHGLSSTPRRESLSGAGRPGFRSRRSAAPDPSLADR
jgi:hypothetical protein